MSVRARSLCASLAVALLLGACAHGGGHARSGPPADPNAYPGELVDSTALPQGLFLRQRIEARYGDQHVSFSAVLQTEAGVLTLLAFTPYGTRAFAIEQRGQQLKYTSYVDRSLPFPPRFILLDVHRTFFRGLPSPPLADGQHHAQAEGELIGEQWQHGALFERTFQRNDHRPAGVIRIRYLGGMRGTTPPSRITLDNGWFHYQLTIQSLAE